MIVHKEFSLANTKHTIFNTKYYLVNPTPGYICNIRQIYLDIWFLLVIQYLVLSNTVLTTLIKLQIGQYIKKNFISNVSRLYPFGNFVMCYELLKNVFSCPHFPQYNPDVITLSFISFLGHGCFETRLSILFSLPSPHPSTLIIYSYRHVPCNVN